MRQATVMLLAVVGVLSLAVFVLKYKVQDLNGELHRVNRAIVDDRRAIHVLEAEWSHLNEPGRLRVLAERHLELDRVRPEQLGEVSDLPLRSEVEPIPAVRDEERRGL